ncbi:MAG: Csp1 family four helix bundle copper storage protein [Deltaproteobacteria bacterium]|nr:Csp1 family four helix bundle copper storage protein [Deltaproteobacteria bacterium]
MTQLDRRALVFAGLGASVLLAANAHAEDAKKDAKKDTKDSAPDGKRKAVIDATSVCVTAGRVCLAACTDHLAHGMKNMVDCQKAVMNMIAVSEAMGATATYNTADLKSLKALASTCATFCRTCEKACEPHTAMHAECKACYDACKTCATACEAFAA